MASKVAADTEARLAGMFATGAQLVDPGVQVQQHVPGQLDLDGTEAPTSPAPAKAARRRPARPRQAPPASPPRQPADALPPGLDPEGVRAALRRAPHRPEAGNVKLTTDLPADLRAELAAYRAWHGFSERALMTLLVRQLLAGDPDGGWRQ